MKKAIFSLLMPVVLAGCLADNLDDDKDNDRESYQIEAKTGVLLDSVVINIRYVSVGSDGETSAEGVTNEQGEFQYYPGDTITFSIGELTFPPATAKSLITPMDLAGTEDLDSAPLVNILRLLQSLDENADLSDGIHISDVALESGQAVNFNLSIDEFAALSAVNDLLNTSLVSVEDAKEHFRATLLDEGVDKDAFDEADFTPLENQNAYYVDVLIDFDDEGEPVADAARQVYELGSDGSREYINSEVDGCSSFIFEEGQHVLTMQVPLTDSDAESSGEESTALGGVSFAFLQSSIFGCDTAITLVAPTNYYNVFVEYSPILQAYAYCRVEEDEEITSAAAAKAYCDSLTALPTANDKARVGIIVPSLESLSNIKRDFEKVRDAWIATLFR